MTGVPATRPAIPDAIADPGVVAIGRGLAPDRLDALAEALLGGGIRAFEVTLTSADAIASIARLAASHGERGLLVGAGTVVDIDGAEAAVAAGARFLVSPHTDPAIVAWAVEQGIPVVPGAMTPTEVRAAWSAGASAVKLFPASAVGPAFVRELRGPFAEIPLLPTGGLTAVTLGEFIEAGAVAVGLGGGLIGDGAPAGVTARAGEAVAAVRVARGRRAASATRSERATSREEER